MPSPVKNYTDPTDYVRPSLAPMLPIDAFQLPTQLGRHWWNPMVVLVPQSRVVPWVDPAFMRAPKPVMATAHTPQIPTPPMGRQLIITFPSIYKERGSTVAVMGQLFPPKAP